MTLSANPSAEPTKKRRRRVAASGASEDCAGCRKRGVQCDRRRPYCSQCLENSTDCPGYRTLLTWNVGVASRGKFRGCSLPVQPSATSPNAPLARPKEPVQRPRANTVSGAAALQASTEDVTPHKRIRLSSISTSAPHPWTQYPQSAPAIPFTNPFPQSPYPAGPFDGWNASTYRQRPAVHSQESLQYGHQAPFSDADVSTRGRPWSGLLTSSPGHGPPAASTTMYPPALLTATDPYNSYFPSMATSPIGSAIAPVRATMAPPSWPDSHGTSATHQHRPLHADEHLNAPFHLSSIVEPLIEPLSASPYLDGKHARRPSLSRANTAPQAFHYSDRETEENEGLSCNDPTNNTRVLVSPLDVTSDNMQLSSPVAPPSAYFQLHPRMKYLLDYYDKAICPVLVDADGPSNPYRHHVLCLALNSTGLQSAIGLLAINNMRMRRLKKIPRSGPNLLPDRALIQAAIGAPDAEEKHYKATAIRYLNGQLADPSKVREDDLLAMLVVLCLFHCADSGFSKFATQLAGVQKLLKMRGGFRQGEFTAWVESFFAWWDVMQSSINDRETLLQAGSLDMLNLSKSLRDIEHFSGCDGRLFKLIARLSRLNLLSQSRPVKYIDEQEPIKAPQPRDFYSMPPSPKDERQYFIGDIDTRVPSPPHVATCPDMDAEARREFWAEWHNLRDRLIAWQCSPMEVAANECDLDRETRERAQHDKIRMSEAFRSAALLYIERLANPAAPCDDPVLQQHVAATLAQIIAIGERSSMTKFLLFPLFLAGTEAVQPGHRALIRSRCEEILQESGFYNNVSALEVLERIWADSRDPGHAGGQAFRWRKLMERADGEYIII